MPIGFCFTALYICVKYINILQSLYTSVFYTGNVS